TTTEQSTEEVVQVRVATGTVGVPHPSGATAAAEHATEEILEPGRTATAGAGGEPGPTSGHGAQGVVLLALLGVGQDRVGLADLLELRLRCGVAGVLVRVVGPGQLAVGLLDRGLVGVLRNTQGGVEVLLQPVLPGHAI